MRVSSGSARSFSSDCHIISGVPSMTRPQPIENNRRTQAMRKLAATLPPAGTNVIVVSHKPNIMDAFGKDWFDVREGEASAFKPDGSGGYKLVARVQANEWSKLAQMSAN